MYSDGDTPKGWVSPFGHPRINACSQLPAAFRSVPRPSSPPGAKASTECPSHARYHTPSRTPTDHTMHRNHPQPHAMLISHQTPAPADHPPARGQVIAPGTMSRHSHTQQLITSSPSEPHRTPSASPSLPLDSDPGQTYADTGGISEAVRTPRLARPETHQNLIHPDKEQRHRTTHAEPLQTHHQPISDIRDTNARPRRDTISAVSHAETDGDDRIRTDDPLLAKQVLSQLSYAPERVMPTAHRTDQTAHANRAMPASPSPTDP